VRRRLYDRLNLYREQLQARPTLFSSEIVQQLDSVLDLIWRYPLKNAAKDAISRQMRLGITDEALLEMVLRRAADENLCEVTDEDKPGPVGPRLLCSMGLVAALPPSPADSHT
jgi:hypothetical protein